VWKRCHVLVLSRRVGESVVVGEDVVITVLEVRGDVIRVGIQAPRHVQVHREEVYREVQRANREAAASSDADVEALGRVLRARPGGETGPGSADPVRDRGRRDSA
jgi:carbon storage regulator